MKKLILVIGFLLSFSTSYPQWVPTYGTSLSNKYILSMTSIGNNLFASDGDNGDGATYISTDNGLSWNSAGLAGGFVKSYAVNGNNLFAGSLGVYVSTNYGTNWTQTSLPNIYIYSLFVNGSNLYAGYQSGIYYTSNNGVNWTYISSGLPFNPFPEVWAINAMGPYLFAGTRYGIYRSSNNGTNWTPTSVTKWVRAFAIIGTYLFAGTDSNLYRSSDNGDSWINVSNGLPDLHARCLFANGSYLFAGTDANLCRSTDNGESWTIVNKGLKNLKARCFAKIGTNIFAGFNNSPNGGGVYISTNNGDYWTKLDISDQYPNSLITKGNSILTSTGYEGNGCNGIFLSSNNGNNWLSVNNGIPNLNIRSLAVNDTNIFAATYGDGVFKSTNNGINWSAVNNGISNLFVRSIAVNGTNVFAGTDSAGVFHSTNNGGNWTAVNNGLTIRPIRCFGVNSTNIFAGTDSGRVYSSSNNGSTWLLINNGITNTCVINCIKSTDSNIYIGTNYGAFKSTNNGVIWTPVFFNIYNVLSLITIGTNIVVGTNWGLYLSTNNGLTWVKKHQGLPGDSPAILSLLQKDNYTFAGISYLSNYIYLNGSVWRRELWELLDVKNISNVTPLSYSLSQNYPNPFNPTTNIPFELKEPSHVTLKVFDARGREVKELVNGRWGTGKFIADFDASALSTGIYFYQIIVSGETTHQTFAETKKMMVVK